MPGTVPAEAKMPAWWLLALLCHLAVSPGTEEGLLLPAPHWFSRLSFCQDQEGLGTVTSKQDKAELARCSPGLLTCLLPKAADFSQPWSLGHI
jgi:hypothetical protein